MKKLTVDDIEVPEGMLDSYMLERGYTRAHSDRAVRFRKELEVVLLWLAEHPIIPSAEETHEISAIVRGIPSCGGAEESRRCYADWQRRMFLKREPAVPAEVKALEWSVNEHDTIEAMQHNEAVRKAYTLGKAGK